MMMHISCLSLTQITKERKYNQRKTNNIKDQELIACWRVYKNIKTSGLGKWRILTFESQRFGETSYRSTAQPCRYNISIFDRRRFTRNKIIVTKYTTSKSDQKVSQTRARKTGGKCVCTGRWATVEVKDSRKNGDTKSNIAYVPQAYQTGINRNLTRKDIVTVKVATLWVSEIFRKS